MTYSRIKIITITIFVSTLLFTVLSVASFWNNLLRNNIQVTAGSIIFLILALIGISALYILYLKASDSKILENKISTRVEQERARILLEFSKQEEAEHIEDHTVDISQKVEEILPKGKFKNVETFAKKLLVNLANETEMVLGAFYITDDISEQYNYLTGYALPEDRVPESFKTGENLNGQVAATKEIMILKEVPEDYFKASSGLGNSRPAYLAIVPFVHKEKTIAILEIATFRSITDKSIEIIHKVVQGAADKIIQLQKSSAE